MWRITTFWAVWVVLGSFLCEAQSNRKANPRAAKAAKAKDEAEEAWYKGTLARTSTEPECLTFPPTPIERITTKEILEEWAAEGKKIAWGNKRCYCPKSNLYYWQGDPSSWKAMGTFRLESYKGGGDVVKVWYDINGYISKKDTEEQPSEKFSKNVDVVTGEMKLLLRPAATSGDIDTIKSLMQRAVYCKKGRIAKDPHYDRILLHSEEFAICKNCHIFIHITKFENSPTDLCIFADVYVSGIERRKWHDKSGKVLTARYVSHDPKKVNLLNEDGDEISIPLARFCEEDLAWLANMNAFLLRY